MTQPNARWPGTPSEHEAWTDAVLRLMAECPCCADGYGAMGIPIPGFTCSLHRDATTDQRWLDGLVFARRLWRMRLPDGRNRKGD